MPDPIRALRVQVTFPLTAPGAGHQLLAETIIADEHRPAYALDAIARLLTRDAVTAPQITSLRITIDAITLQQVPEVDDDAG